MSLAILETGAPPPALEEEFGRYPAMFESLLGLEARSYDVEAGALPPDVGRHDAYLITGSSAGVYETLPWIPKLITFLRAAKGKARLVGICFGHQIMAEAFGGRVEKSAKGWGAGLHSYPIVARPAWLDGPPLVSAPASHQDQVVSQPPGTEIIASSLFTPYAGARLDRRQCDLVPVPPRILARFRQGPDRAALRPRPRSRCGDRLAGRAQRQCARRRMDQALPDRAAAFISGATNPEGPPP